jgi:two-component system cell cycle response regulator
MTTYAWARVLPRTRWPAWVGYLVGNLVLIVVYVLLPRLDPPAWVEAAGYLTVSAVAGAAVLAGVRRHRPAGRTGWLLLAAGQFVFAAAEACSYVAEYLGDGFQEPAPADVLYVAAYPLLGAGLLRFLRRRAPGRNVPSGLDAAIIAVASSLLYWVFLVQPLAADVTLGLATKIVQGAYPIMDLAVLVIAARMLLGGGARTASFGLLTASIVALLAADTSYAVLDLLGFDQFDSPLDAVWMISYALLGAAALHPSMRHIDEPGAVATPGAGLGRLALLAVAVLTAPAVQMIQHGRRADLYVPLVATACAVMFLLVMARMVGLIDAQRTAATTDGLTGLKTRRFFAEVLAGEAQRAARTGQPLTVLIVDVDHFKQVNDSYGHPGGDQALTEVARRLTAGSRAGTVIARYGGEEFALLLPGTGPAGAAAAAENLRRSIGGTPIEVRPGTAVTITASIGAACLPEHADGPAALILAADHALYAAKDAGRNRTIVA